MLIAFIVGGYFLRAKQNIFSFQNQQAMPSPVIQSSPTPTIRAVNVCDVDFIQAPSMENFAKTVEDLCTSDYPKIEQILDNSLQKPYKIIIRKQNNPGETAGGIVYLSSDWFVTHPNDLGAVIHEMAHAVQGYIVWQPSWLIEGIANYVHYRIGYQGWDPANYPPHCGPGSPHYTSGYACSAVFLQYLEKTYDKNIVSKLNRELRTGTYSDSLFQTYTGKNLRDLWQECKKSDCVGGTP